ncbi:MAG: CobD/CbiB family protein [Burkholderiaceae bacterium]
MSFMAILLALLLEQARPMARGGPIHALLHSWASWTARSFDAGRQRHATLAWCVAVPLPALAVFAVQWLLWWFTGWPLVIIWNVAVLYITLGFRQFSHHFTGIRDALEQGDEDRARILLAQWRQTEATALPRTEIVRQVIEYSVIAAHRHVFGVLAWYSVLAAIGLGPAGAVLYRLCEFVPRSWARQGVTLHPVSEALQDTAQRMWHLVDWVPARITAIGFAVVGSFEEAIESWRRHDPGGVASNDGVILSSTAGAINLRVGPASGSASYSAKAEPEVGHLRTVVGLVWRTVLMWMILLALLTLARLLG